MSGRQGARANLLFLLAVFADELLQALLFNGAIFVVNDDALASVIDARNALAGVQRSFGVAGALAVFAALRFALLLGSLLLRGFGLFGLALVRFQRGVDARLLPSGSSVGSVVARLCSRCR